MLSDLEIARCFEFAKELTLEAGKIIKCNFEREKCIVQKNNLEWDFVTDTDYKVEKILVDGLSKEFPNHKIITEEAATETPEMPEFTDAPTWFIDPIDGTINFIHKFPQTCISIGLAVHKELVLGIIYNPSNSELYSAIKGKGAFLNGNPIRTSKVTELKKTMLAIEPTIEKLQKNKDIYMGRFQILTKATEATRCIGSAALTMAYVARGAIDCFHMDQLQVWDVAAGTLIIREAGGTVIDTKGGAYDIMKPNTIAASNETLAQEISKLIVDTDLKTQRKRLKRT